MAVNDNNFYSVSWKFITTTINFKKVTLTCFSAYLDGHARLAGLRYGTDRNEISGAGSQASQHGGGSFLVLCLAPVLGVLLLEAVVQLVGERVEMVADQVDGRGPRQLDGVGWRAVNGGDLFGRHWGTHFSCCCFGKLKRNWK